MAVSSARRGIRPPSAWISNTIWLLPGPPTAGLQGILPMVAGLLTSRATEPNLAAAQAASMPACPPPITMTFQQRGAEEEVWGTVIGSV
ncbi:hypothetical protein GCM10022631_17110 [Deinococcus rubellus]